jgi:tetratricopeptide (TPR) repeat protein
MALAGGAKLHLGKYEESVAWLHRSIQNNRNASIAHFFLAAGLAQLSRIEEARAATRTALALNPMFTINRFRAGAETDNLTFLTQRERIYEGIRKAGCRGSECDFRAKFFVTPQVRRATPSPLSNRACRSLR